MSFANLKQEEIINNLIVCVNSIILNVFGIANYFHIVSLILLKLNYFLYLKDKKKYAALVMIEIAT